MNKNGYELELTQFNPCETGRAIAAATATAINVVNFMLLISVSERESDNAAHNIERVSECEQSTVSL